MIEYEIKPQNKFSFGFKELARYYELLYYFTWRDVKVKYKQTVLGLLWAVLQPIFMTLVFTFFLGAAISQQTKLEIPYSLFAFSGLLIWTLFSAGLSNASNSMVNNANIIKKIYFPRLIIPISAILATFIDFAVTLVLFVILLLAYQVEVQWINFLLMPLAILFATLASLGLGMFLAAVNVKYRDVRYILPFFIQGLLFLSPVMFPISITKNVWALKVLQFNPVAGSLEFVRAVFGSYIIDWQTVFYSSITTVILFLFGLFYFRKTEAYFADLA